MNFRQDDWPRVSALMDAALDIPKEQRAEWLNNLMESQEIKSQLGALLFDTTIADEMLGRLPDISAALLGETQRFQLGGVELQSDKLIGSYRLVRELGKGGMGTVWLAQRVDGKIKREVALKFPYAGPRQRELTERLLRERDILASLEHPNIARLYDADVTDSGQPFLVLEYINGIAINDYCDQQRLDIRQRLVLFQQVLRAVRYAHTHLVIHRDLKPSNILVSDDGIVHLLDFGIATSIAEGTAPSTPLTQFGGRALTPEYASPEQVNGAALTTTSDVYVLGVVLYELLAGTLPYRWQRNRRLELEQAVLDADVIALDRAVISEETASCRKTTTKQLRKILSGELECIVSATLKKQPDQRYASADALADDIARYLDNKPIFAQPDSEWYRIRKFVQRNRGAVASIAAIVIALLAGIATTSWQAHVAKQQRDRAVKSAARSDAVSDFVQLMITEVTDGNKPITIQQLLERSEAIATQSYLKNNDQHAAILQMLGDYYLALNKPANADAILSKAQSTIGNGDSALRARILCLSAVANLELGKRELAQKLIGEGIANAKVAPEVMAQCLEIKSYFEYGDLDLDAMLSDLKTAESLLQKSDVNEPGLRVNLFSDMGVAYEHLGQYSMAEQCYAAAIELLNSLGRGETTSAMHVENNWATFYSGNGNPLKAAAHFDRAAQIALKRSADQSANDLAYSNRARALLYLARYDEAYDSYQMSYLAASQQHDLITMVTAKEGMVDTLIATGRISEAEKLIREIENAIRPGIPKKEELQQYVFTLKGQIAVRRRQFGEAITYFSGNIDFFDGRKIRDGGLLRRLVMRGNAYFDNNDSASAEADATRAYNLAKVMSPGNGHCLYAGSAALLLAKIHHTKNESEESRKWATIAFQQLQGSVGPSHPDTLEAKRLLDRV